MPEAAVMETDAVADILAGCAILDGEGLTTAFGHLSARTGEDQLCLSGSAGPGLVRTVDDLLTVDLAGNVRAGEATKLPGEAAIHLAIASRRPEVASVCRFHGPACMAWSTLGRPLPATIGMALFLGHEIPWFDTSTTVSASDHAEQLAAHLGAGNAILLRGFGAVTVGASVAEAVVRAWLMERAARALVVAAPVATPLPFPPAAAEPFLSSDGPAPAQLQRAWTYLKHRWAAP